MSGFISKAAACVGVAGAGLFTGWVSSNRDQLPELQKGWLLTRVTETLYALYQSTNIQDPYTAKHHAKLVASLSSRAYTVMSPQTERELDTIEMTYFAGYVAERLEKTPGATPLTEPSEQPEWTFNPNTRPEYARAMPIPFPTKPEATPPIFRWDAHLSLVLPDLLRNIHSGFIFAGSTPRIHDTKARDSILQGNYVRCKSELEVADPNRSSFSPRKYKQIDVILTGTTDLEKCRCFKNDYLRDLAYRAATWDKPLNPEHPYSDTPVFDVSEKGVEETGDLTNIPEQARVKFLWGTFTACNVYELQKTRLSNGNLKQVGAILVGTTDEEACHSLRLGEMSKLVKQLNNQ